MATSEDTRNKIPLALRAVRALSVNLLPAMTAIKNARDLTPTCACGQMADGLAKPCLQPVCTFCVSGRCPTCKGPFTAPNSKCTDHHGPRCPHKVCNSDHVVSGFQREPRNGAELLRVVSLHAESIEGLLQHLTFIAEDV
ncbi:hypothetical protein EV121DRAFT_297103 [Schizophyllum commune]